jgi:hypothetical protein
MRYVAAAAVTLALCAAPAMAAFRVQLRAPAESTLMGHGGLHAADSRTATSLVRVISPGSDIRKMGTVRVLVMNLGARPFVFGPDNVTLKLADGTRLPFMPYEIFDRGAKLVERESAHQKALGALSATNFAERASSSGTVNNGQTASANSTTAAGPSGAEAANRARDGGIELGRQPGEEIRQIVDSLMYRTRIAPQEAAGGYLVFELPKTLRTVKTDQPATLLVKTGAEEHRFEVLLQHR